MLSALLTVQSLALLNLFYLPSPRAIYVTQRFEPMPGTHKVKEFPIKLPLEPFGALLL